MRRGWAWLAVALLPLSCGGDDGIVARGWVEGREVDIGPMTGGRLLSVSVEEGDTVEIGATIALLTHDATRADVEVARARVDATTARLAELERGARSEDIGAARADLEGAQAALDRARGELTRLESLDSLDFIAEQTMDDARAAMLQAAARRDAARQVLDRLRAGTRVEHIAAARSELEAARAGLAAASSMADELVLVSPIAGPVLVRSYDPGEVIPAGAPVVTVLSGDERWVRVWLPQSELGSVRVGSRARLTIDPLPDQSFDATVVAISSRAEFTPRIALTEDERADLMYAVRLRADDPRGLLRLGLPVVARFAVDAD